MANANSTPAVRLAPATSFLRDKFIETNFAICQASYLAHFLASTISQQVEDDANVIKIESPASEGFLMVLNQLASSLENMIGLLDECERAALKGGAS
jgi:hypothetical protein